jgi:hypothetical protein
MGDAAVKRSRRERGTGKKKRGGIVLFLIISAIPIGAVTWFLLQSQAQQDKIAGLFEGSGGRAIKAAIVFAVLIALARIALPAFHASSGKLQALMAHMREKGAATRVASFPAYALVWFLWFGLQILFAVDAVLILVASVLVLVLAVRIIDPSVLADVLPPILS